MSQILFSISAIIFQFIYSFFSLRQIRTEELSESVRSVYWFGERLVYEGLSTHLGWYAPLLLIYKTFGFQIDYAKWYRFGLWAVAVIYLASLLKTFLGKYWWLIFLTITTSPTLLYFNQLSTHYGVDISFLIICLWLLVNSFILSTLLWSTAMLAWLSYPAFIYYLPALAILFCKALPCRTARECLAISSISLITFILPLVLGFFFIQNRQLLVFDPQDHGGLFRGAGKWDPNLTHAALRISESLKSFIITTPNYYYEITWPEFGWSAPVVLFLLAVSLRGVSRSPAQPGEGGRRGNPIMFKIASLIARNDTHKRVILNYKVVFYAITSILILNLLSLAFFADTGGTWASIRRSSGILVVIYALVILGFQKLISRGKWGKSVAVISCSILLLYHIIAYYFNWYTLQKPSAYQDQSWFTSAPNPQLALDKYLQTIQRQDIQVRCPFIEGVASDCSYSRIYAAVMGSCTWNRLNCYRIWGWDPVLNGYIPMNLSRWDSQWFWDKADAKF